MKRIYLDHSATTPLDERVMKEMKPWFSKKYGNPSSLHSFGQEARKAVEESRETIAKLVGAQPGEIYFTSGGTESDNLAVKGMAYANQEKGKHIITSCIEHPAVLHTCRQLEREGFEVTYLPVSSQGIVEVKALENSIRKDTTLISVMHANNEIGSIQPIEEIARIAKNNEVAFHSDMVQSTGKLSINLGKIGLSAASASGHKFYGPKGTGFLYMKNGAKIKPLTCGGNHEKGVRSGTENVPGIIGFAKALELAAKELKQNSKKEKKLRDKLIREALKIEDSWLNGGKEKRLSNNVNLGFKGIEGEAMVLDLDFRGIAASTGSACSTKDLKPSHVLLAIGLKPEQAHGSLRLTLGKDNTEKEIDFTARGIPKTVKKLRKITAFR